MASHRILRSCSFGFRQPSHGLELLIALGVALLSALPAAAGPPAYQLFFVPPTPLPSNVSEGGMVTFGVALQDACAGPFTPVTWDISVTPGVGPNPADPTDFGAPSVSSLVFSFTQLTQIFTIPIIDDGVVEGPETFDIRLSPGAGPINLDCAAPEQPPSAPEYGLTVTIVEGAAAVLDIRIDDASAHENDPAMVFDVRIPEPNPGPMPATVDWSTQGGSAVAGEDFQAASGQVTFLPGDSVQQIQIALIDDTVVEGEETFLVQLSNPSAGAQILDAQAVGKILDDDVTPPEPPELSIDDVMVVEGDEGITNATFTVTLGPGGSGGSGGQEGTVVTVNYATLDGTATVADGDYLAESGLLTFAAGEFTQTVTVRVIGDTRVEPDEGFFVELSNPDGAVIVTQRGRGGILNDDAEEPPSLAISDTVVDEGNEGTTNAVFTVSLSRPSTMTVEVDFETMDGTATAGEDYEARSGTLTLAPGQTSSSFNIMVTGDTEIEADELFRVGLANPVGAVIGDGQGRGVIRNDDDAEISRIRFVRDRQTVMEGAGPAEIAVERVGGAEGVAQVIVAAQAGSARAGLDFEPRQVVLRWQPGELGRKLYLLPIVDDRLQEDDEALGVRLSQPSGAELAAPSAMLLSILDDDTPMKLEAVGDQEITARVGEDFELSVRASRMDGSPVAGATIAWRAQGRAELVGPEERESDNEGVSQALFRPDRLPGQATVVARLAGSDSAVSFVVTVEGNLGNSGGGSGGGADGDDGDIGQTLDTSCADATGDLLVGCEFLFGIDDPAERQRALEALTPRNAVAQGNAALRSPRVQLRNIGGRLNALRGGGSRIAAADQLSISIQGDSLAVGTLRGAVSGYRQDEEAIALALDDALHQRPRDGVPPEGAPRDGAPRDGAPRDGAPRDGAPRGGAASADAAQPDTESPWGFFVNGRVSFGDAPQTDRESGYDFETQGLTAGVDYRMGSHFVLGVGLGYLATDVDVAADGGDLEVTGYSLSLYSTYFRRNFYLDGVVVYGLNDYQLSRVINLPRAFQGQSRLVARGEPEGDQLSIDLGAGYDFQLGGASLGGFLRTSLVDATVDPFAETGAGPFDLLFSAQEIESLQSEAGLEISYPASFHWGVLQPSLRLSYLHEFEDDSRAIRAGFRRDPSGRRFIVTSDTPDRDFFNLGAGVTVTLPRSMATYLLFDTDLERDDLDIYTLSGGFRVQF